MIHLQLSIEKLAQKQQQRISELMHDILVKEAVQDQLVERIELLEAQIRKMGVEPCTVRDELIARTAAEEISADTEVEANNL